jgi:hypothetical protein
MDCWVRVPSVGRTLGQISSGGTHESVHRSKSPLQRLLYYTTPPPPKKKTFLVCSWFAMSWERRTSTNLGPLVPFPLTECDTNQCNHHCLGKTDVTAFSDEPGSFSCYI